MTLLKRLLIAVLCITLACELSASKEHDAPKLPPKIKLYKPASDVNGSRMILIFDGSMYKNQYMVYKDTSSGIEINGIATQTNDTLKMRPEYIVVKRDNEVWIDNHLYNRGADVQNITDKSVKNHIINIKYKSDKTLLPPIDVSQSKDRIFLIKKKQLIELFELKSGSSTDIVKIKYELIFQK